MVIASDEADALFARLHNAEPSVVLPALDFVRANGQNNEPPLFEYDTDLNHAWYLIGLAHERNGELSEAAKAFKQAATIWPDDAEAFIAFSNVEGDLDAQIAFLSWGIRQNKDPRIKFNLANAYVDAGRPKEALALLDEIPRDAPFWEDVELTRAEAQSMC